VKNIKSGREFQFKLDYSGVLPSAPSASQASSSSSSSSSSSTTAGPVAFKRKRAAKSKRQRVQTEDDTKYDKDGRVTMVKDVGTVAAMQEEDKPEQAVVASAIGVASLESAVRAAASSQSVASPMVEVSPSTWDLAQRAQVVIAPSENVDVTGVESFLSASVDFKHVEFITSADELDSMGPGVLAIPEFSNFKSVDAILMPTTSSPALKAFQITVSARHPLKASGLDDVIKGARAITGPLQLFLVVPESLYANYELQPLKFAAGCAPHATKECKKCAEESKDVEQFVLKYPFSLGRFGRLRGWWSRKNPPEGLEAARAIDEYRIQYQNALLVPDATPNVPSIAMTNK